MSTPAMTERWARIEEAAMALIETIYDRNGQLIIGVGGIRADALRDALALPASPERVYCACACCAEFVRRPEHYRIYPRSACLCDGYGEHERCDCPFCVLALALAITAAGSAAPREAGA